MQVPCSGTVCDHTGQVHWALGVKRAQAQYGLPSVSTPLEISGSTVRSSAKSYDEMFFLILAHSHLLICKQFPFLSLFQCSLNL